MEQYGDGHPYTALPSVNGFDYLVVLFDESGKVSQGGMSLSPITWSELSAFNQCCALGLNGWELSRLMDMSRAYCSWNSKGSQQGDMADDVPYIDKNRSSSDYLIRQREASVKEQEQTLM